MDLEGNLTIFGPIALFQTVNIAEATGELTLDNGNNTARIYFRNGDLIFAEISHRPVKLGEYLVSQGVISQKDLDTVLVRKRNGKRLGGLLVETGILSEDELISALEEQVKEVIYEVVRWGKGWFQFQAGRAPSTQEVAINIPLDHLMLEGLKRMDEEGEETE
jgi:hypothetical protein